MEIKPLNPTEVLAFRNLVEIFSLVFENQETISNNHHLGKLLSNPNFRVFVIRQNNQVIGGLTLYILDRYYGTKPVAYIYDIAVSPAFQGKGLGKALLAEVCRYCKENGFQDAFVEAESDDTDAVNFYRKTTFSKEIHAIQFTYTF